MADDWDRKKKTRSRACLECEMCSSSSLALGEIVTNVFTMLIGLLISLFPLSLFPSLGIWRGTLYTLLNTVFPYFLTFWFAHDCLTVVLVLLLLLTLVFISVFFVILREFSLKIILKSIFWISFSSFLEKYFKLLSIKL